MELKSWKTNFLVVSYTNLYNLIHTQPHFTLFWWRSNIASLKVNLTIVKVYLRWLKVNLATVKVYLWWWKVNLTIAKVYLRWLKVNLAIVKVYLWWWKVNLTTFISNLRLRSTISILNNVTTQHIIPKKWIKWITVKKQKLQMTKVLSIKKHLNNYLRMGFK